jgi:hypothetical protein
MATVNIQLDFDKLLVAIKQLPKQYKIQIGQTLDAELNRDEINREFAHILEEIWSANEHIAEAEANADIEQAVRNTRN